MILPIAISNKTIQAFPLTSGFDFPSSVGLPPPLQTTASVPGYKKGYNDQTNPSPMPSPPLIQPLRVNNTPNPLSSSHYPEKQTPPRWPLYSL
jgi:hypothetical protein